MSIQQWFQMQPEAELRNLVGKVPFAMAYGCVKAYALLPQQAKDIIQIAYREAQSA